MKETLRFQKIGSGKVCITREEWLNIRRHTEYLFLHISNSCNQSCKICGWQDSWDEFGFDYLNIEDVKFILAKIGKYKKIFLTGGEPTLNENIFEIIKLIKKSGNCPFLWTNGLRLANYDYLRKLVDCGLMKVHLSIDSFSPSTTEIINGDRKVLDLKLQALENLKRISRVKVVITPKIIKGINDNEIKDFLGFAVANNDFIKGVGFVKASAVGMFGFNNIPIMSNKEMINAITHTNLIESYDFEYVKEFNKLRINLNKFSNKFNGKFPLFYNSIPYKVNNERLYPILSLSELKAINRLFKDESYIGLLKFIPKHLGWLSLIRRIYKPTSVEFEYHRRRNILMVSFYEVVGKEFEGNCDYEKYGIYAIEKKEGLIIKCQERLTPDNLD